MAKGMTTSSTSDSDFENGDATGYTFLTVRPQGHSQSPELITMWRYDRAQARCDGWGGAIEGVVFGGRSTKSRSLGRYFGFNGKADFVVDSAITNCTLSNGQNLTRDIDPFNFGIRCVTGSNPGSFSSTIHFRPRQTVIGGIFGWHQYIGNFWGDCCGCDDKRFWFEVSFPVERVENDMRLTEDNAVCSGAPCSAAPADMIAAFAGTGFLVGTPSITDPTACTNLDNMRFGKIDGKRRHTGVADVEFKIGYDYVDNDCCHLDGYLGVLIPTGNKPKGEFVFEPIVGHNRHVGFITGGSYGCEFWRGCSDNSLRWEFATNFLYLFKNNQVRSFDLRNRPWSRYLLVFATPAAAAAGTLTFGINTFTREVSVRPHFWFDMNNGLVFNHCNFQAEIGWNLWAKQGETVKLREPFPTGVAVAALAPGTASGIGGPNVVNLLSNIGNDNLGGDVTLLAGAGTTNCPATITLADLNLQSAASPAALTNTIYGDLGYHWDDWCWPIFVSFGGSYEFSTFNTALSRWLVWGKIGFSI